MEAIKKFLKNEQKYNMFDRKINDINYWEYVRPIISCEANTIVSKSSKMFSKNDFSLKKYFISFKNIKKYFLGNRKCEILVISQPRRNNKDGLYKNNYIDYYVDFLKDKYKVLTIEEPTWSSLGISNSAHNFPIYTKNIYLTDIHELILLLKKKLYKLFSPIKYANLKKEYIEIKNIINSWYEIECEIEFEKYFIDSLIRLDLDRKYINKIIKKTNPKIILLHYMPSTFKEMLIGECNKENIPTIEIQHGTITKVDPLVNKCLNISKLKLDTKYIFSFGENQVVKYALSIKNIKNVIPIGFAFFEEKLREIKPKHKKYILIISQSTIGESIAKFASDLSDLLKKEKSEIEIVFKYHPNEMSNNYSCLKKKNIIEIKNEKSIYDIQNQSILQIGSYSTSLYEGFSMKIPTLVIKTMFGSIETVDIFKGINKGVYFISKPNDVIEYIDKKDILPKDEDINKLWTKNSKQNLLREIKKIIDKENKNGTSRCI